MKKKLFEFLPLVFFALVGLLYYGTLPDDAVVSPEPVHQVGGFGNAFVARVVDGDTIAADVDGTTDQVKVRFLGVNTPESVDPRRPVECFGKEASAFLKHLIEGKRVSLVSDPEADEVDKYGRLLRNVVMEDGTDVNAYLVEEGYAFAYTSFPQNAERKAELLRLEREAREAERGLWSPDTCKETYIDK